MMILLAQFDLTNVSSEVFRDIVFTLLGLLIVWLLIVNGIKALRKEPKTKLDDNPPIEVRPTGKRFNYDVAEARHVETNRRLDGHDHEFENMWHTLRTEDQKTRDQDAAEHTAMRRELADKFEQISRALGRIEGKLSKD